MSSVGNLEGKIRALRIKIIDGEKKLRYLNTQIEEASSFIDKLNSDKTKIMQDNLELENKFKQEKRAIDAKLKELEVERQEVLEKEIVIQKKEEEVSEMLAKANECLAKTEQTRAATIRERNILEGVQHDMQLKNAELNNKLIEVNHKLDELNIQSKSIDTKKEELVDLNNVIERGKIELRQEFDRLHDKDIEIVAMLSQIALDRRKLEEEKADIRTERSYVEKEKQKLESDRADVLARQKSFDLQKKALHEMENEVELRRLRVEKIIKEKDVKEELAAMEKYR